MNTTIDNNELINGLINVLADSITKKVMEKITEVLDKKIADTVEKAIDSYDFSEIVDSNIDEDAIEALLKKGAKSVYFYAIGKTVSHF